MSFTSKFQYLSGQFKVTVIFDLAQPLVNIVIEPTQNWTLEATDDKDHRTVPAPTNPEEGLDTIEDIHP